jgi:osmoprotectant transport system ATP-binding protein
VNCPGPWTATIVSIDAPGLMTSSCPAVTTKNGTTGSPALTRTSPRSILRSRPCVAMRAICDGVSVGNINPACDGLGGVTWFVSGMVNVFHAAQSRHSMLRETTRLRWASLAVPMAAIEFREVSYTRDGTTPVLDGLTVGIAPGQCLALVGRSGAGKTTALKMVNRLLDASRGTVLVDGRDVRQWDLIRLRRSAGYVIQEGGLFPHRTVIDNLATVPRLEGWEPARIEARVDELLELIGLSRTTFGHRWPHELSGGQRQRVGIARALAVDPPILLMDEPFGALDPLTRAELQEQLLAIQRRLRKTIILVSHDIPEAAAFADRMAVLEAGRVVACGPPAEILDAASGDVSRLLQSLRRSAVPDALKH